MNYKNFDMLSEDIKKNLFKIHPGNYDLVVGIPRSGMIPAYMIGLYLNTSVTDLSSLINNVGLMQGITRKSRKKINNVHEAKRILLVDDSIMSGRSMKESLASLPASVINKITTLAVYSDKKKRDDIDIFLEYLPAPRVFEWNIYHRGVLEKSCVDIDGVLCVDPTNSQNDDGVEYINFLLSAKPLFLPSYRIHSLVTNRLEKYRPETEEWLKKKGVEYDNLIMLDLPSKEERLRRGLHAENKANYYKKNKDIELFIESDVNQAHKIMTLTGKPVYCVDRNIMFDPGLINSISRSPYFFIRKNMFSLYRCLPLNLKRSIKFFLGK